MRYCWSPQAITALSADLRRWTFYLRLFRASVSSLFSLTISFCAASKQRLFVDIALLWVSPWPPAFMISLTISCWAALIPSSPSDIFLPSSSTFNLSAMTSSWAAFSLISCSQFFSSRASSLVKLSPATNFCRKSSTCNVVICGWKSSSLAKVSSAITSNLATSPEGCDRQTKAADSCDLLAFSTASSKSSARMRTTVTTTQASRISGKVIRKTACRVATVKFPGVEGVLVRPGEESPMISSFSFAFKWFKCGSISCDTSLIRGNQIRWGYHLLTTRCIAILWYRSYSRESNQMRISFTYNSLYRTGIVCL